MDLLITEKPIAIGKAIENDSSCTFFDSRG